MMKRKTNISYNSGTGFTGTGFTGLLTIAFIVLKLTDVISWSWWWVLSPILIETSIVLAILIIWLVVGAIIAARNIIKNTKGKK